MYESGRTCRDRTGGDTRRYDCALDSSRIERGLGVATSRACPFFSYGRITFRAANARAGDEGVILPGQPLKVFGCGSSSLRRNVWIRSERVKSVFPVLPPPTCNFRDYTQARVAMIARQPLLHRCVNHVENWPSFVTISEAGGQLGYVDAHLVALTLKTPRLI